MDKQTARMILASYRAQDANDPVFAEALRELETDPELAAWFEESQRFDAVMSSKLQDFPVPRSVKEQILTGGYATSVPVHSVPRRQWQIPLGIAAGLLLLGMITWKMISPTRALPAYAMQAINFTNEMPALQFVCFNASAVAAWVNEQPGAQRAHITLPKPDKGADMAMVGSSVVDWNGQPVVMIALQNHGRMAMFYILPNDAATQLREGATETYQRGDWVVRATNNKGQLRIMTAKGKPENLDFPVPF